MMPEPLSLDALDDDALDRLPFGVVRLGPTGIIERYNRTEAERAGIQRWRALGRDFFRDVAGTNAGELAAHVQAVPPGGCTRVLHTFRGYHRADAAIVDLARSAEDRVYLCIRTAAD